MTVVKSNLTAEKLNEMACDYAISIYLREGEIPETMLKEFSGNKIQLAKFLRQREFAQYDIPKDKKPYKEKVPVKVSKTKEGVKKNTAKKNNGAGELF